VGMHTEVAGILAGIVAVDMRIAVADTAVADTAEGTLAAGIAAVGMPAVPAAVAEPPAGAVGALLLVGLKLQLQRKRL